MYLNIDKLSKEELDLLEGQFGKRLSAFHNLHYQVCVDEIIIAFENTMSDAEFELYKRNPMFGTHVSELAQILYVDSINTFDELYEKAMELVFRYKI